MAGGYGRDIDDRPSRSSMRTIEAAWASWRRLEQCASMSRPAAASVDPILRTIPTPAETRAIANAIASRRSMRAFLPDPVPREVIEEILRGRVARAVGHQHPAVEGRRADRRKPRHELSRRILAAYDDPVERAEPHRRVRLLPDRVALALHRPAPQGRLGPVRPARHRARPTRRACTRSTAATTSSSTRRSA